MFKNQPFPASKEHALTPEDIPEVWRNLLAQFQLEDPKAVLAGGAMRDLWCGRTHKDLDIFTTKHTKFKGEVKWDAYNQLYIPKCRASKTEFKEYAGAMPNTEINAVFEGVWFSHDLNIIECKPWASVQALLEGFDFGICQIAFDGKQIIKTPAFDWDYKYAVFTMTHGRRYEKSKERFERINQRYNWKMMMPDRALVDAIKIKWKIGKKTAAA